MRNRFDWDEDTRKNMLKVINALCDRQQNTPIASILRKTGFTMDEYHSVASLGLPAVQYSNLYARTMSHYKGYRKNERRIVRRAGRAMDAGQEPREILEKLLMELGELFDSYNNAVESLTEEEAGVIEDDE